MKKAVVYIHGKGGSASEADAYRFLFKDSEVIGLDYEATTPWEAKAEFNEFFDDVSKSYGSVILIASSIGAYFSITALRDRNIEKAYFISPAVDMESLILNMMRAFNVSEEELEKEKEIKLPIGETLSWRYLSFARENELKWRIPTEILYGENDELISRNSVEEFARNVGGKLTVYKGGEHWFHTDDQMQFLFKWIADGFAV